MKILLTGITGNLGYEVAKYLNKSNHKTIPLVHSQSDYELIRSKYSQIVVADLLKPNKTISVPDDIDSIIHCAGIVNFKTAGNSNQKMMRSIINIAQTVAAPIFYVSTAFLFRPANNSDEMRNSYESDKYKTEVILHDSQMPHTTIRPSVLVGHSKSGQIRNFSGYYLLINSFIKAAKLAATKNDKVRFPILSGASNMVPVDQVATLIGKLSIANHLGKLVYATNPNPPKSAWVLEQTLNFFNIRKYYELINCDFATYAKLAGSPGENTLYKLGLHMNPYWTLAYDFPQSALTKNLIDKAYLNRTLKYYRGQVHHPRI